MCPCGKGYIDKKQDYTPEFRDGTMFCFMRIVRKNIECQLIVDDNA